MQAKRTKIIERVSLRDPVRKGTKMRLTILTPTYNRNNNLMQLYVSLTKQSNLDFQWLIMDDGSTDETEFTVKEMVEEDMKEAQKAKTLIDEGYKILVPQD